MRSYLALLGALCALSLSPAPASPQSGASTTGPRLVDDAAIDWFLPADFDAAVDRAKEERRLVLIKGVSFGIDKAGASCATAGTW